MKSRLWAHSGYLRGQIELCDRLETAALARRHSLGSAEWAAISARFAVPGCQRPMLTFLLSMADAGFVTPQLPSRVALLARLQAFRVARQARSARMLWVSVRIHNAMGLLNALAMRRGSRPATFAVIIRKGASFFLLVVGKTTRAPVPKP